MRGNYFGHDEPYPPPNDLQIYRYFCGCSRSIETISMCLMHPLRQDIFRAMHGHGLAEAAAHGKLKNLRIACGH